ncbi:DNA mismatch repair protein MutS [Natronomonas sp. LN261]|uniref:DNA mismatch repair protein MutS n=1 Tax=Natronomonas sp. LN261 TaxID=2750669 RepID=UPI0015EE8D51|nr:DNA mismatch repair protein MutS [Natronomonas sp. LN261]
MSSGIVGEFFELKADSGADLLAMQMGDFYEFFGEDAELVGEELDLKVSERASGGESYAMAGVPVDDLTPYVKALAERGYRVAVADQRDDDGGIVREVVRIVTPGTLIETDDADAQYLASVACDGDGYGLAVCDVTTGRFRATTLSGENAGGRTLSELYRFDPVEVLPGPRVRGDDDVLAAIREDLDARLTLHETEAFAPGRARHRLTEQFGEAAGTVGLSGIAITAAGAAIDYIEETGVGALASVTRIGAYEPDDHVAVDATTQRNLEVTEPMTPGGRTLFGTIDHTETSAGGRLLKEWLTRPLRRAETLETRHEAVEALLGDALVREGIAETLSGVYDVERAAARAVSGSADADALLRVRETLASVPDLYERIDGSPELTDSPVAALFADLDRAAIADLRSELSALADDPPKTLHEGGLIKRGYDEALDDLVGRHEAAVEFFETLEAREKDRHGFSRVTVGRNKTDGYYVQIPKSEAGDVPEDYEGIKTLKNAERYVFEELREKEREIFRLEDERGEREYEAFCRLRGTVADRADLLGAVGRALAELDAYCSLATHAARQGWARPELTDDRVLDVESGRHPVVETETRFVPNDLYLDRDRRFLLVTGPNMSGKSTYMRQAALVTLLAQVGSFVPADAARVGLVDGIYTRVGALDELAGGRSTFMVEMEELSNILHSATEDSLVILDEVGRGTATYDGISIAWAATEYLHNEVGAFTLFATHYHELTSLAEELPRVENVHVAVAGEPGAETGARAEAKTGAETGPDGNGGSGEGVTFLRTIEPGATDRSYGVHVADLAGVPAPVVDRAGEVLRRLREERAIEAKGGSEGPVQTVFDLGSGEFQHGGNEANGDRSAPADGDQSVSKREPKDRPKGGDGRRIDPETAAVLGEIREASLAETSPVELMNRVREWQRRLEGE